MLNKSIKFKKNKVKIPQGNIKRYQNKNNLFVNSFILKNQVKPYSKTIEQVQINNLRIAKLFKSINDKKEQFKERKSKRFQDKNIKYFSSFNKLNSSSQNKSISLNKKINNRNNIIKTNSFNFKALSSTKYKSKKYLKNNSQKPMDKKVIDSKTNNVKKIQNKINIKIFSKSVISNNSTYDNKIIDDNVKIENIHSDGDLVKSGEIRVDDSESKKWNDMNDINENNVINNPRSLESYSSIVFSIKKGNDIKRQSLSVSKENKNNSNDKNSFIKTNIFKSNNPNELEKGKNKFNNIPEIKNLNQKIEIKNKNIEKIKKLIEYYKKQMVKYDNEIIQIDNWILREEKEREILQVMVNFLNMQ